MPGSRQFLVLLMLLCLLIVFPLTATASDAVIYSSTTVPVIVPPQHNYVDLGSLVITIDPLTEGEHSALIALPRGYSMIFPGSVQSIEDPHLRLDIYLTGQTNEFKLSIDYDGDNKKSTFIIPIRTIIPAGVTKDIMVKINGVEGQLADGTVVVGRIFGGKLTVVAALAELRIIRPETEVPFTIEVAEDRGDILRVGSETMKFILPEGFGWLQENIIVNILEDGGYLPEVRVDNANSRILYVDIKEGYMRKKGSFSLTGKFVAERTLLPEASVIVEVTGKDLVSSLNQVLARVVKPETEARFIVGNEVYFSNGRALTMDVVPYIKEGKLFLPLLYVGLSLGVHHDDIKWNGQVATLTLGDKTIQVRPSVNQIMVNDKAVDMEVAAEVQFPGRVMLPYRFIAEAFGATVNWDAPSRTVTMEL